MTMQAPHAALRGLARPRRSIGIAGGPGSPAAADFLCKLVESVAINGDSDRFDLVFEQRPPRPTTAPGAEPASRKLQVFELLRDFERRGVDTFVLPCFASPAFVEQLRANSSLDVIDMVAALRAHVRAVFPAARRIGVLAAGETRSHGAFEHRFEAPAFSVVHPRDTGNVERLAAALSQAGDRLSDPLAPGQRLRAACDDLVAQGVDLVLPALAGVDALLADLGDLHVPVVDTVRACARLVASRERAPVDKPFKIGVVGGVGPAATVDFLHKIVRHTDARRDQDHVKVLVEQNPQIPDRTEHLIRGGADPTIALHATCKRLEAGGADLIAIPCNTAHAFVARIQPYLAIPIVDMLAVTAEHVATRFPGLRRVGLLATSGTVASGVYQRALSARGLAQVLPTEAAQARVMNAIYGPGGVKAGFIAGACQDDIRAAVEDLVAQDVDVVILGCTELPLLLPQSTIASASGREVALVDPTSVLARYCVEQAVAAR